MSPFSDVARVRHYVPRRSARRRRGVIGETPLCLSAEYPLANFCLEQLHCVINYAIFVYNIRN